MEMPTGPWKRTSSGAFLWLNDFPKSVRPNMLVFEAFCGFDETGQQGKEAPYSQILTRTRKHLWSFCSFIY